MSKGKDAKVEPSSAAVLDASAALATIQNEPGAEEVDAVAARAVILSVNLCEVVTKLVSGGVPYPAAREVVQSLGIRTIAFDDELAYLAASLVERTKSVGLSLGDRACLALGIREKLPVLTTERLWKGLDLPVKVRLLR